VPYTFTLTTTIPATAQDIYDAWLDSVGHTEMTGGDASMSDEIGAEVSAWDGYISGRNLELVPGERIVQSWRTTEFSDEHDDSIITVTLEEVDGETLLTLIHSNVPDGHTRHQRGGWQEHYFEPMIAYFAKLGPDEDEDASGEAAPAPTPTAMPEPAAPKSEAKPAAPKPKAKPGKLKSESPAPARPKPKRAKTAKVKAKKAKAKAKSKSKAKPKSKLKSKSKSKSKAPAKAKAKRKSSRARRGR
jgi:uncharacterized protein YndB with AHSA1/START domain